MVCDAVCLFVFQIQGMSVINEWSILLQYKAEYLFFVERWEEQEAKLKSSLWGFMFICVSNTRDECYYNYNEWTRTIILLQFKAGTFLECI